MSHYTVLVAIDPNDPKRCDIETALAPFDEDTEVEPYRQYETGEPVNHWSWEKTPDSPAEPTWAQVAEAYNAEYGDDPMHVDDDGRAYTMSTYSPMSRWDWWIVGGRWTGWFQVRPEWIGHGDVINGTPGTMTEPNTDPDRCDGGPKRVLDFARTRDWAQVDEAERYAKFQKLIEGTPDALPWSSFIARHEADEGGYSIDRARREFHTQPRVQVLKGTDFDWSTSESIERFQRPREEALARAAARAVPGYALLTLDGQWKEPGKMGWFGMSTDTPESADAYYAWANEYVDSLGDETLLVLVDVHI